MKRAFFISDFEPKVFQISLNFYNAGRSYLKGGKEDDFVEGTFKRTTEG